MRDVTVKIKMVTAQNGYKCIKRARPRALYVYITTQKSRDIKKQLERENTSDITAKLYSYVAHRTLH